MKDKSDSSTELEKLEIQYYDECGKKYKNHVDKYIQYIKSIDKANTLSHIALQDIENCIIYYIQKGSIKTVSSLNLHFESIKSFYDFLRKNGKAVYFLADRDNEEFKEKIIQEFNLTSKITRDAFHNDTIIDILKKLDSYLSKNYFEIEGELLKNRFFHRIALRFFIKMTLIAPAKRNVICNLTYEDFSDNFRKVNVNSVSLSLPNSLHRDILRDLSVREQIIGRKIEINEKIMDYLFDDAFVAENLNRWFYSFIKEEKINGLENIRKKSETFQTEAIRKTAISNLMKNKANLAYVSLLTDTAIGSLESTYRDEIFGSSRISSTYNEEIEWEIKKSSYYNYI